MLQSVIDVSLIAKDFSERMALTKKMIIFAGLYTIVVNFFIEELFFRGFVFQGLLKSGLNKGAYIISSLAFALYHISNFKTWFNIWLTILVIFGLFVGGLIFSYFVKKTDSFLASWLIHLSADLGIIIIGFRILGIY
jgi:membrane protease YdiL (CAAX protease family)